MCRWVLPAPWCRWGLGGTGAARYRRARVPLGAAGALVPLGPGGTGAAWYRRARVPPGAGRYWCHLALVPLGVAGALVPLGVAGALVPLGPRWHRCRSVPAGPAAA